MDIGIGLPNAVPGTTGEQLVEWAKRAEARGFTTLGTIDRFAYPNYEPMTALAAAAAVTERIGLSTSVLLAPLRANAAAIAKQALSLQALSGGRLILGLGIGGRETDYEMAEIGMQRRGAELDEMLRRLHELFASPEMGPHTDPPTVMVGGGVDASFARAARFGAGWIAGGIPPEQFAVAAGKVREAWAAAGREDSPRLMGLAYYSLGDRAEADAQAYLTDYYGWLGEETAGYIAGAAAKDPESVKAKLAAFEEAGCQELILFPSASDPDQVDLLADATGI
ncbi:MAG: LLM class flavin-dependent oxidoreductase [Syntrophothermus sp.]